MNGAGGSLVSARGAPRLFLLLGLLGLSALAAGCSANEVRPFRSLKEVSTWREARGAPLPFRCALAPITVRPQQEAEGAGGADGDATLEGAPAAFDAEAFDALLRGAVKGEKVFREVLDLGDAPQQPSPAGAAPAPGALAVEDELHRAYRAGADLLLEVELVRYRAGYEGRNGWAVPGWAAYGFGGPLGLLVADERYAAEATLRVRGIGVGSERPLFESTVAVRVARDLDDGERGISIPFLFFYPLLPFPSLYLDGENAARAGRTLEPFVRQRAVLELLRQIGARLRPAAPTAKKALRAARATVHALVIGAGRYDEYALHNVRFAQGDARAVAKALCAAGRVPWKNVRVLLDAEATGAGIRKALGAALARAGADDHLVVYFAGRAARVGAKGKGEGKGVALLLPSDARVKDGRVLGGLGLAGEVVARLDRAIARSHGRSATVILDAGLAGGVAGRAYEPPGGIDGGPAGLAALAGVSARSKVAVLAAAGAGQAAQEVTDARHGLLTFHLVRALSGAVPRGTFSWREAVAFAAAEVRSQAALEGRAQEPEVAGRLDPTPRFRAKQGGKR